MPGAERLRDGHRRPPQQQEIAEPVARDRGDRHGARLAAELERRRLVVERRQHHLVGAADVVGQREDRRAVQRAQLRPRALLEQALEVLPRPPGRSRDRASASYVAPQSVKSCASAASVVVSLAWLASSSSRLAAGGGAGVAAGAVAGAAPGAPVAAGTVAVGCGASATGAALRADHRLASPTATSATAAATAACRRPLEPGRGNRPAVDLRRGLPDVARRRRDGLRA